MVMTAAGSVLVAGMTVPADTMHMKVKVVRPFMYDRKAQPVGTVLDLARGFAHEMVSCGKAEYYKDPPAVVAEPETEQEPEAQAESEPKKRKRGT